MRNQAVVVASLALSSLFAQEAKWPYSMDFGSCLTTTFDGGGLSGTTEKGLVIRLGANAAVAFDTELLRLAVGWPNGWLDLRGTAYDGSHGPFPSRRGPALVETRRVAGAAVDGGFVDPRPIPHGPLPRSIGRFLGYRYVGGGVEVDYRIGGATIVESHAADRLVDGPDVPGGLDVLWRNLRLGASDQPIDLLIADAAAEPTAVQSGVDPAHFAFLRWSPPRVDGVLLDVTAGGFGEMVGGGPSNADCLDPKNGIGATIDVVPGFASLHGGADETARRQVLARLCDGAGAGNDDDWQGCAWFDRQTDGNRGDRGRYVIDLRGEVDVEAVQTFSWHRAARSVQRYTIYGTTGDADAAAADPASAGWTRIAEVDTSSLGQGCKHAAMVGGPGARVGNFRRLLLDWRSGGAFLCEVDVFADRCRAPAPRLVSQLVALHDGGGTAGARLQVDGGRVSLHVPARTDECTLRLAIARSLADSLTATAKALRDRRPPPLPAAAPGGVSNRWGEPLVTAGVRGPDDGPFAVDTITIPFDNPFGSRMRTAAFDFFRDGRAAVSTWNGDVWVVSGIDDDLDRLEWRRFATGLFDPLGLRIVDDVVHVHGRDGLTRLFDDNGDGEADRYECFNNMVCVTPAFHEFAFDLQTDPDGNFYFSKGAPVNPGGRGFMPIAPHHGTIMRVSKDGSQLDVIASGLRAPNGIGVSPDGKVVTSGDNEGTFMPRCRLNWIEKPGFYGGVKDTAHRRSVPDQPDLPLCWMPMEVDNSSGDQVWVTGQGWPDLQGRLLHLSYGTCSVYLVLEERVNGQVQGGVVRLPANFSSSCMRGRYSPVDGQLYVIGLQGWQTSAAREGGFHRVRRTSLPLDLPVAMRTCERGVYLTFPCALDPETAADPESYGVQIWNYRYSPNYGSPELSVLHPEREVEQGKENRDPLPVTGAELSPDGRTVLLRIDGMRPVHQMKVTWNVDSEDGRALRGELHASIHAVATDPGFPQER